MKKNRNLAVLNFWPVFCIFILVFLSTCLAQQAPATQQPTATAIPQKISLDIKGMDIVEVLKMLSTRANMNIVVGKNVSGRVTMFLKDVDTWDAFEIILLANDLAYEKKGDIINVITQRDYELLYGERYQDKKQARIIQLKYAKASDLARTLNQIKTNVGKVVVDETSNTISVIDAPEKVKEIEEFVAKTDLLVQTRVFELNYAQADKLSSKLQDSVTKGIGAIKIDERTNKIAITDFPQKLDEFAKVIAAFDEKTPQVLIDAQIIELKPTDQFQMGVDWRYWIEKYFELKTSLPINTTNALIVGTPSTNSVTRKGDYKAILDLLRTIGTTNVLSSPRIIALNNQEAKIHIGTRDAYITSTTSQGGSGTTVTSQTVNFVDWGIQLHVTPTINRDGFVTMKIKPEVSDATRTEIKSEGQVTQIPIISTSEAETTVMVKDGVTIIIGGLRKDKQTKTEKRIPFVGDIPFLGKFFGSTDDKIEKDELVILLTPHIISGKDSIIAFSEIPPKEGAVARMEKGKVIYDRTVNNKPESDAEDYSNLILYRIKALTAAGAGGKEKGEVRIAFTVARSGALTGGPDIIEANNPNLTSVTVNAVKAAAPFPKFPDSFEENELTFKVSLSYE